MSLAVMFILGAIFGCILAVTILVGIKVGRLRIDTSDPYDGPFMFLELTRSVDHVYHKKYVLLEVNTKNFTSQE